MACQSIFLTINFHMQKQTITVKVPATSANLGPGFDCAGLSLNLYNRFTFTRTQREQVSIDVLGEGQGLIPTTEENLIVHAMKHLCRSLGQPFPTVHIEQINHVPAASGLGSSSTAVVAGLLGANRLLGDPLDRYQILELATEMEGHPDNVAPAIYGGLVVTCLTEQGGLCYVEQIELPPLQVVLVLPDFSLLTRDARNALPNEVSRADAIYNIARLPLVVRALEAGDYQKLGAVMLDKLHQPYRIPLVPGMADAFEAAKAAGAAAVAISGAGPGTIAFSPHSHDKIGRAMIEAYERSGLSARMWQLQVEQNGSQVVGNG